MDIDESVLEDRLLNIEPLLIKDSARFYIPLLTLKDHSIGSISIQYVVLSFSVII